MTPLTCFAAGVLTGIAAAFALLAALAAGVSAPGPAGDPCHPPTCRGCDYCTR